MQRFVEEHSEPDDELFFCVIDAVNDDKPPLIREMIERIRPNAHSPSRATSPPSSAPTSVRVRRRLL